MIKKEQKTFTVSASESETGGILIFGDTHFSAIFSGKHVNYQEECIHAIKRIKDIATKTKPSAIFFLGDLIGVSEKKINDGRFLLVVTKFFDFLSKLTKGNIYSVIGNHDIGDDPTFNFLEGMGYIKTATEVDYIWDKKPLARFHLVNYGEESRKLNYGDDDEVPQVVLGHNEYSITGVTNWYKSDKSVELSTLHNFSKVNLVISGHIHLPSESVYTQDIDGNTVSLYYPGAVNRVAASERYEDCTYISFSPTEEHDLNYTALPFGLMPVSEVFIEEEVTTQSEEELELALERENRDETLRAIIDTTNEYRLFNGSLLEQVDKFVGVSEKAKKLAREYLEKATDNV